MKNKTCGKCVHFDGRASCLHRHRGTWGGCEACSEYTERNKPTTNGDRIRAMSDEELAVWGMYDLGTCPTFDKHQTCPKCGVCSAQEIEQCWLNWLNQEAKDER